MQGGIPHNGSLVSEKQRVEDALADLPERKDLIVNKESALPWSSRSIWA